MTIDEWPATEPEDVIDIIRRGLQSSGLNQRQLSELLGITQKHMSMMMQGKANISMKMMFRICEELNIHPVFCMMRHSPRSPSAPFARVIL